MKSSTVLLASSLLSSVLACGFAKVARGSKAAVWKTKRSELLATVNSTASANRPPGGKEDSNELLGDLVTQGARSEVGKLIEGILLGKTDAVDNGPQMQTSGSINQCNPNGDKCCVWSYIAEEMFRTFTTPSGRCSNLARGAVRLGFHDAGAWKKGLDHGGADGGILLTNEIERDENKGLEEIAAKTKAWYTQYRNYGIGMADLIQMGANVATVTCPLGPRIKTFVGRPDSQRPAEPGLLPDANDSADNLIRLFEDKTIKAHGLVALVGAHSTSQQRFFDPRRALDPQDSTPGVWDVLFYSQTTEARPKRIVKFPSDINLSRHPRTKQEWDGFAGQGGQDHWNDDYAREYVRLSLLGVNNINALTDCTKVLPRAVRGSFRAEDQYNVDQWANGGFQGFGAEFGALIGLGELATNTTLQQNGIDPSYISSGWGMVPPPAPLGPNNRPEGYRGSLTRGGGIPRPTNNPARPPPAKAPSNGGPSGAGKNEPPNYGGRPPSNPRGNPNDGRPNVQPKGNPPNNPNPPNRDPPKGNNPPANGQPKGNPPNNPNHPPNRDPPKGNNPPANGQPQGNPSNNPNHPPNRDPPKGNNPPANSPPNGNSPNNPNHSPNRDPPKGNNPPAKGQPPQNGIPPPREPPRGNNPPNREPPKTGNSPNREPPNREPPRSGNNPSREPPRSSTPPSQKAPGGNQQPKFGGGSSQPPNNGGRPDGGSSPPRSSGNQEPKNGGGGQQPKNSGGRGGNGQPP